VADESPTVSPARHGLPRPVGYFIAHLRALALALRAAVMQGVRGAGADDLARVVAERGGDVIYRLDEHGEAALLAYCARWGRELPLLLVAEGLDGGQRLFPEDADATAQRFTLIVDPIDGTRELMYAKRSAWALFGVAPAATADWRPTLADIAVALQAELPTARAALADVLWATRGGGARGETHDLRTGAVTPFVPTPSTATTLEGGFATVSKFFPGAKVAAARLEERLFAALLGPPSSAAPQVFDDEYISTGGQLYELLAGHDRFLADLRPLLHDPGESAAGITRIACHPYDICTALIAREAGVVVTDPWGTPVAAPLDTTSPVAWVGYANETLRQTIAPVFQRMLAELLTELGRPGGEAR
jgi:fructose-1,6-bisphosphatase/inositol monophosphatase family enzyme